MKGAWRLLAFCHGEGVVISPKSFRQWNQVGYGSMDLYTTFEKSSGRLGLWEKDLEDCWCFFFNFKKNANSFLNQRWWYSICCATSRGDGAIGNPPWRRTSCTCSIEVASRELSDELSEREQILDMAWKMVWSVSQDMPSCKLNEICLPNHNDNDGGGWWMVDDDGWWTIDDGRWMTMVVKVHDFVKACCKVGSCQVKNVDFPLPNSLKPYLSLHKLPQWIIPSSLLLTSGQRASNQSSWLRKVLD